MRKILIVDDEEVLVETLVYNLEQAGYQVITAAEGRSALEAARRELPDVILLDLMLPGMDGLQVCQQLRREERTSLIPILILTARGDEIDRVVGLEMGADDYVTKPFGRREVLARVRALLRRSGPALAPIGEGEQDPCGPRIRQGRELATEAVRIDLAGRRVWCRGKELELQPRLFDLLVNMVRNRGTVLTRDQLLQHVWGYDYAGDTRTVDVHVRWLREKLEEDPANPKCIQTVRGVGYCFR